MVTEEPRVDLDDEFIQKMRDAFQARVFPTGEPTSLIREVSRAYTFHSSRPYVCSLMADVLSGRWGLGKTQEDVAERIGMDRTRVSDALRKGELSFDIYLRLRCCPRRPKEWEPNIERLRGDMERCGFIAVAQCYATLVPDRIDLIPEELDEMNYELICELFCDLYGWLSSRARSEASVAKGIIARVVADRRRNVVPAWYTTQQAMRTESKIRQLLASEQTALAHLIRLQQNWLDIFVWTFDAVTGLKWT